MVKGATQVWLKQIIWLGSLPLAQVTQNATGSEIVYLHADHLNTPRKTTNSQQQVVWQWSSDAYGNGAANEDVDGDQQLTQIDLRFPGQLFDAESGLYYNYYRYYDPKTGRYITSDPIGLVGGINTFAYVEGNPVKLIDALGLWSISIDAYLPIAGGGVTIGRDPNGSWFWGVRAGRGLGAGLSLEPYDTSPGYSKCLPTGATEDSSHSLGLFAHADLNALFLHAGPRLKVGVGPGFEQTKYGWLPRTYSSSAPYED